MENVGEIKKELENCSAECQCECKRNPDKAGRPTILTEDIFRKIKSGIYQGKSYKSIANENGFVEQTFYDWVHDNYLGLRDKIDGWRRDRMLIKAEGNLAQILDFDMGDKENTKIVQDTSKFVTETLGSKAYSKLQKMSGIDGEALVLKVVTTKQDESSGEGDNTPSISE